MLTAYLVLDLLAETPDEVVIDKLFAALDDFGGPDTDFAEEEHQTTPTQTFTRFSNESGDVNVTIWQDNVARLRYLELSLPTEERLDAAKTALRRHFDIVSHEEVVQRISSQAPTAELPENIFYQLGYSAPGKAAAATVRVLSENLASGLASRREGAATAAGLLGWREMEGPLRAACTLEKDSSVRNAMERALRVFG